MRERVAKQSEDEREDERANQWVNESVLLARGWMVYYSTTTNERMRRPYLQGPSRHRELSLSSVGDETVVVHQQQQQHVTHVSAGDAVKGLSVEQYAREYIL